MRPDARVEANLLIIASSSPVGGEMSHLEPGVKEVKRM